MVVQKEDAVMEASISKQTKKYIVIKNHVRELLPEAEGSVLVTRESKAEKSNRAKSKNLKRKKGFQKVSPSVSEPAEISKSDLEELKNVYKKCKIVLQTIEAKYGHLLNLDDNESLRNTTSEDSSYEYCRCSKKRKIVFDESGQKIEKDCQLENHICLKRINNSHSASIPSKTSIQVEYDDLNIDMPDDLQQLENILKDVRINNRYRQMVIDKIYLKRQEYLNDIRYEKQKIIMQLKENPEEALNFKGTNLSSLPGYPTKPIKQTE